MSAIFFGTARRLSSVKPRSHLLDGIERRRIQMLELLVNCRECFA